MGGGEGTAKEVVDGTKMPETCSTSHTQLSETCKDSDNAVGKGSLDNFKFDEDAPVMHLLFCWVGGEGPSEHFDRDVVGKQGVQYAVLSTKTTTTQRTGTIRGSAEYERIQGREDEGDDIESEEDKRPLIFATTVMNNTQVSGTQKSFLAL